MLIVNLKELMNNIANLFDERKYDEAEKICEQMLKKEPENLFAKVYISSIKIEKGEYEAAKKIIDSLGENIKKDKLYWKWLGQIENGYGNFNKSITMFDKALEIDPKYSQVYNLIIKLYEKRGNIATACMYLFKAMRNIGKSDYYNKKLKEYQQFFMKQKGLQAPNIIKIVGKEGKILIKNIDLGSIDLIQNLDITRYILTDLAIINAKIKNISNLEKLIELQRLRLSENKIEKIEGLDKLAKLESLNLNKNRIKRINRIENLENLKSLYLNDNQLESLEGIESISNLLILEAKNNNLTKITHVEKLTKLSQLHLSNNIISSMKGLEKNTRLTFLSLDNNDLDKIINIEKMPNLYYIDFRGNKKLHPYLGKKIDKFSDYKQDILPYIGLNKEEVEQKIIEIEKKRTTKVKQQLAKEKWQRMMDALPGRLRIKFQNLLKTNTIERCLYCGKKIQANKNWKEECQERIKELLFEANKKLPEKLRSIVIDTEDSGPTTIYEMKGPMGQKKWESRTAWASGLGIIKDISSNSNRFITK